MFFSMGRTIYRKERRNVWCNLTIGEDEYDIEMDVLVYDDCSGEIKDYLQALKYPSGDYEKQVKVNLEELPKKIQNHIYDFTHEYITNSGDWYF